MAEKNYRLLLIEQGIVIKELLLEKKKYLLGRADDTDLTLSGRDVSRHHAMVVLDGEKYIIEDLQSTNGTYINGQQISLYILKPGDEIVIGENMIVFDDGTGKFVSLDETEVVRKGSETAIIEDQFVSLQKKLKDQSLKREFKNIEGIVKKSRKRLSDLATRDRLTRLYNREYFERVAQAEFNHARESTLPFSLLFIDIDHFKKINDQYGHTVGDDALRTIASLVQSSCRKTDIVARYGGEEIVVILPDTKSIYARTVATDIRGIIEKETIKLLGFRVTVSIGIATYSEDGKDLKSIIENADKALYQAKRRGRNRVCKFNEEDI